MDVKDMGCCQRVKTLRWRFRSVLKQAATTRHIFSEVRTSKYRAKTVKRASVLASVFQSAERRSSEGTVLIP
jgi:hypothetical protein